MKVTFTVRKAGRYEVAVKLGGLNVAYSPYYKIFQPGTRSSFVVFSHVTLREDVLELSGSFYSLTSGTVVPSKTKIAYHFSTLVLTHGQQHTLQIEPRDEYGNPTSNSTSLTDEDNYSIHVHSVGDRALVCAASLAVSLFKPLTSVLSSPAGHRGRRQSGGTLQQVGFTQQAAVPGSVEADVAEDRLLPGAHLLQRSAAQQRGI